MTRDNNFEARKQEAYEAGQDYGYRGEWVDPSSLGYEGEIADAFRDGFNDVTKTGRS